MTHTFTKPDPRGPLLRAVEMADWPAVVNALLDDTAPPSGPHGCRLWTRRTEQGYAVARLRHRSVSAHRLMARASRGGEELGSMAVHHRCSSPTCIAPTHLQVITPHENTAEMLERNSYLRRIAALELALAEVAPGHALL